MTHLTLIMARLHNLYLDKRGATAIEYGLICALIFLVIVTSVQLLSGSMNNMYDKISNAVTNNM